MYTTQNLRQESPDTFTGYTERYGWEDWMSKKQVKKLKKKEITEEQLKEARKSNKLF